MESEATGYTLSFMAFTVTVFLVPDGTYILVEVASMRGQLAGPGLSLFPRF